MMETSKKTTCACHAKNGPKSVVKIQVPRPSISPQKRSVFGGFFRPQNFRPLEDLGSI